MPHTSSLRTVLTPTTIFRIVVGWTAFLILFLAQPLLAGHLSTPVLFTVLATIVAVIIVCAGGVVTQAEHLAHRLDDPYGTLVLTLSIVLIEVILISAVMLGPGEHATIARDAVMAATMIILTILLYGFFLYRQTGTQNTDFQEVSTSAPTSVPLKARPDIRTVLREHRAEVLARVLILLITVVPIVLLSHDMAVFLDDGLGRLGAPIALSGILITLIVFLPEAITTVRAAWLGEAQRVTNLAHGALVSCVVPVVLAIGLLTDQTVILAESPANLLLLGVSLLLSLTTFSARRVTALHGAAHLFVFALYALSVFS